jgi:hypothetical protein
MKVIKLLAPLLLLPALAWAQHPPNSYSPTGPLIGGSNITIVPAGSGYTIAAAGGGGGAPATNPPGGASNYAPITNPAFTGSATVSGNPIATTTSGTFTPTMTSSGGALTGVTYQNQYGYWSIVGNLEYVTMYVYVSAWSGGGGNLQFTYTGAGAPCAQIGNGAAPQYTVVPIQFSGTNSLTAGYTWVTGQVIGPQTVIGINQNSGAGDANIIPVPLSLVAQFVTMQATFTCRTS